MIAGYTGQVHGVDQVTFALQKTYMDLVVGGFMKQNIIGGQISAGFVYYQQEGSECSIKWMLNLQEFDEGV